MKLWFPLLLVFVVSGCGIEGLHNANPKTVIRIDPMSREVYLSNNKDVDVEMDGLDVDIGQKRAKLDKLILKDSASTVRTANYTQMLGMAYQAQVNWQGAAQVVGAFGDIIRDIIPFVPKVVAANALGKLNTVNGGSMLGGASIGPSEAQVKALLDLAGTATQPAGG